MLLEHKIQTVVWSTFCFVFWSTQCIKYIINRYFSFPLSLSLLVGLWDSLLITDSSLNTQLADAKLARLYSVGEGVCVSLCTILTIIQAAVCLPVCFLSCVCIPCGCWYRRHCGFSLSYVVLLLPNPFLCVPISAWHRPSSSKSLHHDVSLSSQICIFRCFSAHDHLMRAGLCGWVLMTEHVADISVGSLAG